jgi:hypothetical protein
MGTPRQACSVRSASSRRWSDERLLR